MLNLTSGYGGAFLGLGHVLVSVQPAVLFPTELLGSLLSLRESAVGISNGYLFEPVLGEDVPLVFILRSIRV